MKQDEIQRVQAKTRAQRFLNVMEQAFHYAPKIAEAILAEAEACLMGEATGLKPGQMPVILLRREARQGCSLRQVATQEVIWTVDGGEEDQEVARQHGVAALRRVRLLRLLSEALEQGAVASQEDVARALQVSVRTIKRDCAYLQEQGITVPTRGHLQGIGRGQTHKAQIVGRWLRGETYDQVARHSHHSLTCVQRYIQTFVRVIQLHHKQFTEGEISLALQLGPALVQEYLAVYAQHDTPFCRQRLEEQLARLSSSPSGAKRGA